jgi:hypothetical protein
MQEAKYFSLPVLHLPGAENIVWRNAGLAQIDHFGPHEPARGQLQVRAAVNVHRALAAQLQRDRSQVPVGCLPI